MLVFAARRLGIATLVLITVSVIGFTMLRLSGDLAAMLAGDSASADQVAAVARQYGLDRPLVVQYFDWAFRALRGDFGVSLFTGETVWNLITSRLGVTMTLALSCLAFALIIAIPLGIIAATRPNSWVDRLCLSLAVFGQGIPNFWFGLILIYVFGVMFRIFPISGSESWLHFVLPTITLGLSVVPSLMRLTRAGMIEVLAADYIRTARAKGLGSGSILFKHALRNAILPVISVSAVQLGFLLGGSVIVEAVFSMNGVGLLAFNAITSGDFPVVQSILVFLSFTYVLLTFFSDLINARLDPRIRL